MPIFQKPYLMISIGQGKNGRTVGYTLWWSLKPDSKCWRRNLVQFDRRLARLELWAWQNVVKWSEVEDYWRTTLTLFDAALAQHMSEAEGGDFWDEACRVMSQKARDGLLP